MDVLGIIFLVIVAAVVVIGLALLIRSIPDIQRYRRIRGM